MIVRIITAAALVAAASPLAAKCSAVGKNDPAALSYICDSERGWAESVATGDTGTVKRILADDFIGVDPKGPLYRKAEMVADTARSPRYFVSNRVNDVIVRLYGNMAIAQGSETWERER